LYDVDSNGFPVPTFDLISAPPGMIINTTSGLIEWVPVNNGEFLVDIQAENAAGSDSQEFTIVVVQPPSPTSKPTIEPIPAITPPPDSEDNFIYLPVAKK
jgi:hypothetical protein